MKATALFLIACSIGFGQTPAQPPREKHAKLKSIGAKIKHDAKIGGEVVGAAVIIGLVVIGAGGAQVKVY